MAYPIAFVRREIAKAVSLYFQPVVSLRIWRGSICAPGTCDASNESLHRDARHLIPVRNRRWWIAAATQIISLNANEVMHGLTRALEEPRDAIPQLKSAINRLSKPDLLAVPIESAPQGKWWIAVETSD